MAAIIGWIGWTFRHRRPRVAEVATALLLMVASLIGFLALYVNYGMYQG